MVDWVLIDGLEAEAIIGVFDWERQIRQRLVIDLEVAADLRAAADSDRLEQALDYAALSRAVLEFAANSRYRLLEALAEELAALILRDFAVRRVRLKIAKPGAVAAARNVAVCIERDLG